MGKLPVSINLGLVYGEFFSNPVDTLKSIAEMGYKGVEAADTSPMPLDGFVGLLKDLNLKISSIHTGPDEIENNLNRLIEFSLAIENKYIVLPWYHFDRLQDADSYRRLGWMLSEAGTKCRDKGIWMCYHHHNFEFARFDGKYGMDILIESSDAGAVKFELDTYWLAYVGEKPLDYIKKNEKRCALLHLKDMLGDKEHSFTEVGRGIIDFKAVCDGVSPEYLDWLIVEQDVTRLTPLESCRISFENLKKLGGEKLWI